MDLAPLEAFPWFVRSGPATPAARHSGRTKGSDARGVVIHAALAAAFAALCAGAFGLAGGSAEQAAPAVEQTGLPQGIGPAATAAAERARTAIGAQVLQPGAAGDQPLAGAAPAPVVQPERAGPQASPDRARPMVAARVGVTVKGPAKAPAKAPAPRVAASLPEAQPLAPHAANVVASPPPPVADSRASAATLREFRSALDMARDAARDVIRLESRQRPDRGASAEEMTGYRLRQQNAAAARNYRNYLDTLSRSVRDARSETLTRHAVERARQTHGYLAAMLADSQASLR